MEVEKSLDLPCASWKPRKAGDAVQSESKGLKTRGLMVPLQMQEKTDVSAQIVRQSEFSHLPSFCSIQALNGLDEAHPHWGEQSALLNLWLQISSRNTLTETPRKNVQPNIWTPRDPVKLIHKINHHRQAAIERDNQEKALRYQVPRNAGIQEKGLEAGITTFVPFTMIWDLTLNNCFWVFSVRRGIWRSKSDSPLSSDAYFQAHKNSQ